MPMFVPQRALYEARERPSKIYRWTSKASFSPCIYIPLTIRWHGTLSAYLLSNIIVELIWHSLMAPIMYFCWYYPVGFVRNTTPNDQAIRGFLVFLFLWVYLLFTSTFAHFAIFWIDLPETAGVLTSLFWMLCILFCGWVLLFSTHSKEGNMLRKKTVSGSLQVTFLSSGRSCTGSHQQHTLLVASCLALSLTLTWNVLRERFFTWPRLEISLAKNFWPLTLKQQGVLF